MHHNVSGLFRYLPLLLEFALSKIISDIRQCLQGMACSRFPPCFGKNEEKKSELVAIK
jgi:hypothetical protein